MPGDVRSKRQNHVRLKVVVELIRVLRNVEGQRDAIHDAQGKQTKVLSHSDMAVEARVSVELLPALGVVNAAALLSEYSTHPIDERQHTSGSDTAHPCHPRCRSPGRWPRSTMTCQPKYKAQR